MTSSPARNLLHSQEPTMIQLLAQSPSKVSQTSTKRMETETTGTHYGVASWRKGQGFNVKEGELLKNPEVRRKADVAQLCESTIDSRSQN